MKKIIIIALMAMFVGCAPKPEQVAQNLIKEYLQKTLDDPSSYEAVEFGQLDTIKHLWVDYAAELQEQIEAEENIIEMYQKSIKTYQGYIADYKKMAYIDTRKYIADLEKEIDGDKKSITEHSAQLDSLKVEISKEAEWEEFKGLRMTHSFRSVTPLGKMLLKLEFKFDKALTTVESAELTE